MEKNWENLLYCSVLFFLLTIIFNLPLSSHPGTCVTFPDDPLLTTWILSWGAHQLATDWINLFESNMFFPHEHTFAYSEHMLGIQPFFLPLYYLQGNPVLAHNFAYLLTFWISGIGVFLLARHLGFGAIPSFIGGFIYAFCPYRFGQVMHLQVLSSQWYPFLFLFMHRFMKARNRGNGMGIIIFFNLQALSSYYHAVYAAFAIILFGVISVRSILPHYRDWIRHVIVPGICLTLIIQIPLMIPYYQVKSEQGFFRDVSSSEVYAASLKSYIAAPECNHVYGTLTTPFRMWERTLFPGLLPVLLSCIGILRLRKHVTPWKTIYLVIMLFSFLMSLGPYYVIPGVDDGFPLPYLLLYHVIPGLKALRVPSRIMVLFMLGLSVFSAGGIQVLLKNPRFSSRSYRGILVGVIATVLLVEYISVPIPSHRIRTGAQIPEVYQWLARQTDDPVVIELPFQGKLTRGAPVYVYYSVYHWKRMVNGYSGFFPHDYRFNAKQASRLPEKEAIIYFRDLGVDLILDHEPYQLGKQNLTDNLECIREFETCRVYRFLNLKRQETNTIQFH